MRVRVLDLPFTAVEWVLPGDMLAAGGDPLTPAKWMVWDRSPLAKERSLAVSQQGILVLSKWGGEHQKRGTDQLCQTGQECSEKQDMLTCTRACHGAQYDSDL